MRINKGVALSIGLLASVSLGITQKPDTSQYLTKFTTQDLTQERRVREIQNQKGGVMNRFNKAIRLDAPASSLKVAVAQGILKEFEIHNSRLNHIFSSLGYTLTYTEDTSNISEPRPEIQQGNFTTKEEKIKKREIRIIGLTLALDVAGFISASSYYIAGGIKFFRFLNIFIGTGRFTTLSWGAEYNYWMIGTKVRVVPSTSLFGGIFPQLGMEYGWATGLHKEIKGGALSFGIGYESPIFFHLISLDYVAQVKGGSIPMSPGAGLGMSYGITWYFK